MQISLSIFELESDLRRHIGNLNLSRSWVLINQLVKTGNLRTVHIDIMRPSLIPSTTSFPIPLIRQLYEMLRDKIPLDLHFMVKNPFPIIWKINNFMLEEDREETVIFIQRESFKSEEETIRALNLLRKYGYSAGICINLPTPFKLLTADIINAADHVLLMSVPMGRGGQKFCEEAKERISTIVESYPETTVWVDGGINEQTIIKVFEAGAKVAVVGSFLTRSAEPERTLMNLYASLRKRQKP
ncbi:MAG: hypothetical protein RMJ07_01015 [Nitrososphaerota archaeon]|nr:hypothetical protein [Candidatus Bathyarchaeota archaeon]MDW8048253.1 hypothetical protein [Nitrososphaerota archaeon]